MLSELFISLREDKTKDNFLDKVRKTKSGCWVWTGARIHGHGSEYGTFFYKGKRQTAHRVSYQLFKGALPSNKQV